MTNLAVINCLPRYITYGYRGFRITYENNRNQRIARIYQDGQLRAWASDLEAAVEWIDESCLRMRKTLVLELAEAAQARDKSQKLGNAKQC